jgi:hypothetical protein
VYSTASKKNKCRSMGDTCRAVPMTWHTAQRGGNDRESSADPRDVTAMVTKIMRQRNEARVDGVNKLWGVVPQ